LQLENQGSPRIITSVTALGTEIAETLKSLDPLRAKAFERAIHELLLVVRPDAKVGKVTPPPPVDAKGWPLGYWEKFAGCWADVEFESPVDPPPEQHPY
jgi:hypothetical protein